MKKPSLHTRKPKPPAAAKQAPQELGPPDLKVPADWDVTSADLTGGEGYAVFKTDDPPNPGTLTVTFTGDPRGRGDPANPTYRGKSFPKGQPVVVDDAEWVKLYGDRLRKHSHFKVE
jgi:hypothetical protein